MMTMNEALPAVSDGDDPEIDDPEVGQTGGKHQTCQAHRIGQMAFVQVEATALLIRKERFNVEAFGIVIAGLIHQAEIGDQVERLALVLVPPGNRQERAIAPLGEAYPGQSNLLSAL